MHPVTAYKGAESALMLRPFDGIAIHGMAGHAQQTLEVMPLWLQWVVAILLMIPFLIMVSQPREVSVTKSAYQPPKPSESIIVATR